MQVTTTQIAVALLAQWIVVAILAAMACDWNPPHYIKFTPWMRVRKALYCAFWPLYVIGFIFYVFWLYTIERWRESRRHDIPNPYRN